MTCDGKYFYHQLAVRWSRQGLAGEIIWLLGNIGASWLGQSSSTTSTRRGAGNIYIPLTTSLYYHNFLPSYHPHTITTTLMTTRFRNINQPSWGLIRKIHKMKKANQPMVGLFYTECISMCGGGRINVVGGCKWWWWWWWCWLNTGRQPVQAYTSFLFLYLHHGPAGQDRQDRSKSFPTENVMIYLLLVLLLGCCNYNIIRISVLIANNKLQ